MKSLDWHAVGTLTCAQCKPSSIWFSAFTFTPRPHPHCWHACFTHRHRLLPHLSPPASGMPPPPLGLPWGCLRAAGATALLLSQVDLDVICLIRRWSSDKMLHYLHVQAYPLMKDYARRMLSAGCIPSFSTNWFLNDKPISFPPFTSHPFFLWPMADHGPKCH